MYIISGHRIATRLGKEQGLKAKELRSFMEDDEGRLWIGTYGGGVCCYDKGKLRSVNAMKNCMLLRKKNEFLETLTII